MFVFIFLFLFFASIRVSRNLFIYTTEKRQKHLFTDDYIFRKVNDSLFIFRLQIETFFYIFLVWNTKPFIFLRVCVCV